MNSFVMLAKAITKEIDWSIYGELPVKETEKTLFNIQLSQSQTQLKRVYIQYNHLETVENFIQIGQSKSLQFFSLEDKLDSFQLNSITIP